MLPGDSPDKPFDVQVAIGLLSQREKQEFHVNLKKDGDTSVVRKMTLSRTEDALGNPSIYIIVLKNISKEFQLGKELEYQANEGHDY